MANEVKKFIQEAGYKPLEDRCIIVKPAPGDLSEKIVAFFKSIVECELCVLQMCEHELILLPFDRMWTYLKKDVSLVLPYKDIQAVEVEEDLLNFVITIRTEEETIRLTTQQAALSDLRSSGVYATIFAGSFKNWHKENLDGTLKALTELGKRG